MKTLTTLTIAAALAAGMSVAGAQSSMQKPAGAEQDTVVGNSPFCAKPQDGATLNCEYASRADCQKVVQPGTQICLPNPNLGTTGAGSMKK